MWYSAIFAACFALGAALSPLPIAPAAPKNISIHYKTPAPVSPCAIRECRDA